MNTQLALVCLLQTCSYMAANEQPDVKLCQVCAWD